jgi:5-methylcytosine-specific restriction endonuclease McrA
MSDALRRLAPDRAGGRCVYCQLPDSLPPFESFHLEHIVARQHGGKTELENLAWACHRCNYYKGPNLTSIDPETQAIVPLFNPRRAIWDLHFVLQGFRLIGLTPVGRTTVSLLQMNAERRIERRAELVRRGLF